MKDGYVVALGVPCIDEYGVAEEWPREGEKSVVRWGERKVGGMIPNAACVMAGMGRKTYLVAALNAGPNSEAIRRDLARWGLDLSHLIVDEALPDMRCVIVRTERERTILVPDSSQIRYPVDGKLRQLLLGAGCVYTSMMEFHRLENWEALAGELRENGVGLVFDLETSTFESGEDPLFRYASLLFFNEQGLEKYAAGRDGESCIRALLAGGAEAVAVTLGAEGCYCAAGKERVRLPGNRVEVVDTTGAGDTFNCAFTASWMAGRSLAYAAEFANAAAARAVTVLGSRGGIAPPERIEEWMRAFARERKEV